MEVGQEWDRICLVPPQGWGLMVPWPAPCNLRWGLDLGPPTEKHRGRSGYAVGGGGGVAQHRPLRAQSTSFDTTTPIPCVLCRFPQGGGGASLRQPAKNRMSQFAVALCQTRSRTQSEVGQDQEVPRRGSEGRLGVACSGSAQYCWAFSILFAISSLFHPPPPFLCAWGHHSFALSCRSRRAGCVRKVHFHALECPGRCESRSAHR